MRLFHFDACAYCEKVRFALDHLGIVWEGVSIDPAERAAVVALSGQPLVPVLDDDGKVIADSTRILEYLAEEHDASLRPRESREQGLASIFEDWADEALAPSVQRYLTATEADRDRLRVELDQMVEALDATLHDRLFIVGDGLTAADISVFSFLAGLDGESREALLQPYINIRDWYMNMADFREKSGGSGQGGFSDSLLAT